MLPSRSTLEYAAVVKPCDGNQDTGVAAADVSDLNDVTTAHTKGSSHATAMMTSARIATMRSGLANFSPVRRLALRANRPRMFPGR